MHACSGIIWNVAVWKSVPKEKHGLAKFDAWLWTSERERLWTEQNVSLATDNTTTSEKQSNVHKSASSTCSVPKKKTQVDKLDEATTSALHSASESWTVCQQMAWPNQQQQPPPSNETRAYCDMLYHRLSSSDETEREEIQLELQQAVMRYTRRRSVPIRPASFSAAHRVTSTSVTSHTSNTVTTLILQHVSLIFTGCCLSPGCVSE